MVKLPKNNFTVMLMMIGNVMKKNPLRKSLQKEEKGITLQNYSKFKANFVSLLLCFMKLSKYVLNVFFWRQTKLFFYILFLPPCIAAFSNSVLKPVKIFHVNQRIALRLLHCSTHHYTENTHVLFSQPLFFFERRVGDLRYLVIHIYSTFGWKTGGVFPI